MSRSNELADCVKRSLERYFKDMDGEKPTSIYEMGLKNIEKPMIETVLGQAEGNQSLAAEMLGVTRNTLRKKMRQQRIKRWGPRPDLRTSGRFSATPTNPGSSR